MATYRFKFDLVEPGTPTRSMTIRAAAQKMGMTPNDFCRVAALGMAEMILSQGGKVDAGTEDETSAVEAFDTAGKSEDEIVSAVVDAVHE